MVSFYILLFLYPMFLGRNRKGEIEWNRLRDNSIKRLFIDFVHDLALIKIRNLLISLN